MRGSVDMTNIHHPILTTTLLIVAVLLANVCAIGVLVMRDAYQRLQYATPVVCFSTLCTAVAVWLEDPDPQARIKVVLIGGHSVCDECDSQSRDRSRDPHSIAGAVGRHWLTKRFR